MTASTFALIATADTDYFANGDNGNEKFKRLDKNFINEYEIANNDDSNTTF